MISIFHEIEGSLQSDFPKQITVICEISISPMTHSKNIQSETDIKFMIFYALCQISALLPISIDLIALLSIVMPSTSAK